MRKTIKYFLVLAFSFMAVLCGQSQVDAVVGLLYIDGLPVRVQIDDGVITNVESVKLEQGLAKVYVAPGLIDIQIRIHGRGLYRA